MTTPWPDLLQTAVLGTEHAVWQPPAGDDALTRLLARLGDQPPEARLLNSAGVLHWHAQAGQLPLRGPVPGAPPPSDTRPPAGADAVRYLDIVLSGMHQKVLPDLLAALDAAGLRLPETHLPNLLDWGSRMNQHRAQLLPVLGARGRWLAAQHPAWGYAAAAAETWDGAWALWQAGNAGQRQGLLRQLRARHAVLARQLLESVWGGLPVTERMAALRLLEDGLDQPDEPFLEHVLDDRMLAVRRLAAELLTRLPQSRLRARLTAFGERLLTWRNGVLSVSFPLVMPAELGRDGVTLESKKQLVYLRSEQLRQIIGAVTLAQWTEGWGVSAETIIAALPSSRWPRTLATAFAQAALRQRNLEWAEALLDLPDPDPAITALIAVLPPDRADALLARRLAALPPNRPPDKDHPLVRFLAKWPHPWTRAMTHHWLALLAAFMHHDPQTVEPAVRGVARAFAFAGVPDAVDAAEALWNEHIEQVAWRNVLDDTLAVLRFRRDMLAAVGARG